MRPAVVLVHGYGGSARSFAGVIDRLGEGWTTCAVDLPGFGSAAAELGPHGVADYADIVETRMRTLGGRDVILVGHSMGGKVALELAARRPPGLRALVLLAPSPPTPEPIDDAARSAMIAGWSVVGAASATLARTTARPLPDTSWWLAIDDMMRSGKAAWTAWPASGSREDISASMARIAVPVTILSGTADIVLPTSLQRGTADRLADARVVEVPGAGHLLPLEAPDTVAAAIERVAAKLDGADAETECVPLAIPVRA